MLKEFPSPVKGFVRLFLLLCWITASGAHSFAQTSGVLREVWYNLQGGAVSDLTSAAAYPSKPDEMYVDSSFEAPSNFSDYYGQRMQALLLPPVTGDYTFWIASDDSSALFLSTDENPANRTQIAFIDGWAPPRGWSKFASAKSNPIRLTAGKRYYIMALQKEGTGGDNLAVTWQKPGDSVPADNDPPIAGQFLLPYGLGSPKITVQPANTNAVEGGSASFSVQLAQYLGATFQWHCNGKPIPGATTANLLIYPVALTNSGNRYDCGITNAYGGTNTTAATLTVTADVTPPSLASVSTIDPRIVTVVFSEAVEASSATVAGNYTLSGGAAVQSASFGSDERTIILSTTPLSQNTYTLTVNNVRDRATKPNPILPNSTASFTIAVAPLDIAFLRGRTELAGPSSRHGGIVISEIMYSPTNRSDGLNLQFIELFNSNPFVEDISEYRIAGDVDFKFPENTTLNGRSYMLIAAVPADIQTAIGLTAAGPFTNKLSRSSGTLRILNRLGGVLFEVTYSDQAPWPAAAGGGGHSLILNRASFGEHNPAAWTSSDLIGGTPGRAEVAGSNPFRCIVINEILAHTDPPDWDSIELFNYSSSPVNLTGCVLTDDPTTNKFVIPADTIIPALGFVYFDERQLGFRLSAAGESIYLKNPFSTRVIDAVRYGAQENGVSYGRYPDGAVGFQRLETKTFGSKNSPARVPQIVINEIMYDPISGLTDDQYVELYNRTASPIDVSRWRLEDGISYTIPVGTVIPNDGYLVIARNAARLLTNYAILSGANTLGDFSGKLSHNGERIALSVPDEITSTNANGKVTTNTIHIVVDEVTYGVGGRWGQWAKQGGSSLELVDVRADHRMAPNWADSDETLKSDWRTIETTGVLENGSGTCDMLHILLLGPGECLVDNVEVVTSDGKNIITNGDFETGASTWVAQGNHEDTSLDSGGLNSAHALHIRSTDHGDTGANRVRLALTRALSGGETVTLRARVRWLAGCPEILLRLRGNWLEATGNFLTAVNLGTPGARNTRAKSNIGPVITDVTHFPLVPSTSQSVLVSARISDPDGVAALLLKYRIDPATNLNVVTMVNNGAGVFSASIPSQAADKLAAFYIEAMDNASPRGVSRFPSDAPVRECLIRWGDPAQSTSFGTYRVWMTQATLDRWSKREHLSNKPLDCTFVYGTFRAIYNMGAEYSGSPWHSPGYNSPLGNVCDYLLAFPEDDSFLGETDATLQWPGNGGGDNTCLREQTAYWLAEQIGLPYCYRRSINLLLNGQRRGIFFEDVQQPNGDMTTEFYPDGANGNLHKLQIWYEFDNDASAFTGAGGATFQNILNSRGQKSMPYYRWTLAKRAVQGSANDYSAIFQMLDAINYNASGDAYRQQLERFVDVGNFMKTYAIEHVVGNSDSFAYGGGQNMYTYKPQDDRWKLMIWDIDFAFSAEPPTNNVFNGIWRGNGIDLNEPSYLRQYFQILQDTANGPLLANKAAAFIDPRYNAMIASGITVDNPAGIKDYISQRRAYLLNLIATNVPARFALTINGGANFSTNRNLVTLSGTAPVDVRSISINGIVWPIKWTTVSNWTAQIALPTRTNALVVLGLDAKGNPINSASNSLSITCTASLDQPQGKLVISEIMHSPLAPDAGYVELYNASSTTAFDLSGWSLKGLDYVFPDLTIMPPLTYLIIAENSAAFTQAYGAVPLNGVYNGKLDPDGETLRLVQKQAGLSNEVVVAETRYENRAPWPDAANRMGASLQLVDPTQDNFRVANWSAVPTNPPGPGPQWRYVTATGTASSSTLYIYLQGPGDAYVDDIKLVAGSVAESGPNLLANGDFEASLSVSWGLADNMLGSSISTEFKHAGSQSLHMVATSSGSTRSSSIYQDISPALVSGAAYTLSFWYRENTNALTLTSRLSGSGIMVNVSLAPDGVPVTMARFTPGAGNTVSRILTGMRPLWCNEIMPENLSGVADRFGHRAPWLELFNSGKTNVNLSGVYLTDSYSNLIKWAFPAGTQIRSNGFMIVWLDGQANLSTTNEPHASFIAPKTNGSIALVSFGAGQTNILDYLNYGTVPPDRSYGASPDGSVGKRQVFYYATPCASNNPASPPLNVVINEWMADNKTTIADPADSDFEDWFEVYNPGESAADLAGFYFGTSLTNKTKFKIPSGYIIPPQGRLLVWADGESSQNSSNRIDLHANFKLDKDGDAIGIFAEDGTVIDFVSFGPQTNDVSQGRYPDGAALITTMSQPTPRNSNIILLPNTPPTIEGIADQMIFEGQTLLLTVKGLDSDVPAQILRYSLDVGAPIDAQINPDSGLLTWRPQSPCTNDLTIRVYDSGSPALFSTATFTVRVIPRPKVLSVQPDPRGACTIQVAAIPGRTYRIEFKNALEDAEWHQLDLDKPADSSTVSFTIDPSETTKRFFRIVAF